MRTLFFMIMAVVFFTAQAISPDLFNLSDLTMNLQVEEGGTEIDLSTSRVNATPTPTEDLPMIQPSRAVPTPTEIPVQDPASMFGEPKSTDDFSKGSSGFGLNAGLNDDDSIRIISLNNKLSLEPKKSNGWINWRLRPPTVSDSAAEMDFSFITCARGDRTGIVLRAADYNSGHGYYFSLACEGLLSIMKDNTVLGTVNVSKWFRNGSGDVNTLAAVARGNTLTAFLNGEEVASVQDNDYLAGYDGFFTSPQGQDTLKMEIEAFRLYYNE